MPNKFDETMKFSLGKQEENVVASILSDVYKSLEEKGYDPVNQIIGYIISGDPTYITSYNESRKKIKQIDRNDLLEEILKFYLKENGIN